MTTLALSWQCLSRRGIFVPLLIVSLLLAPLLYAAPLVGLSLDDLNMVAHFAEDDLDLYRIHGHYENGPIYAPGFDTNNIYPKAFYNLAGVVLYPYAAIGGDDFQVVLIAWRTLNVLVTMGSVILLFLLARRIFNSDAVAWVGALLLAITPGFLLWSAGVRPNPLELMFIITTLYFCVRLLEEFSYKFFLLAAVLSGLAFATKFGGWYFLGLLPLLSVYVIWRSEPTGEKWAKVIHVQHRLFQKVGPVIVGALLGLAGVLGWLLWTHSWEPVTMVADILESGLPPDRLERALVHLNEWGWLVKTATFGVLLASVAAAIALMVMWRASIAQDRGTELRSSPILYMTLFGLLVGQVALIYTVVFFLTGPLYLAHPTYFVTQIGYGVYFTLLGGSFGAEEPTSIVESSRKFALQFHYGWIAFGLLLAYAGYKEVSQGRRDDTARRQRVFLWLVAGVIVAVAVLGVRNNPQIRHVLPALAIFSVLIAGAIVPKLVALMTRVSSRDMWIGAVTVVALISVIVTFHIHESAGNWDHKMSQPDDTGLKVGEWLLLSYPTDTRIMTDWRVFYVPPAFTRTSNTSDAELGNREQEQKQLGVLEALIEFDPDVLVITHPEGFESQINVLPLLTSDPSLRARDYRLVQRFEYDRAEQQRYKYEEILIYERGQPSNTGMRLIDSKGMSVFGEE